MRNLLNGEFEIDQENWVLSILRRQEGTHCYLLLEGLNEANERVAIRFELGYKKIGDDETDDRYYQILESDKSSQRETRWFEDQAREKSLYFQSFLINQDQKNSFLQRVRSDITESENNNLTYVKYGNKNSLAGGFFGASVASVSGEQAKQASVDSNLSGSKSQSVNASLQRGHSCLSWAQEKMQETCPDYKSGLLGKLFISVPQLELTGSTGCVIC